MPRKFGIHEPMRPWIEGHRDEDRQRHQHDTLHKAECRPGKPVKATQSHFLKGLGENRSNECGQRHDHNRDQNEGDGSRPLRRCASVAFKSAATRA